MSKNSKKPVLSYPRFNPVLKSVTGFFGNRCNECGSFFDEDGFCNNGHQMIPAFRASDFGLI